MFLRYRTLGVQDLPECLPLIRDSASYEEDEKERLLCLWREALPAGRMIAAAIENVRAPVGRRILLFWAIGFVTDTFSDYLQTSAPPIIGKQVLRVTERRGWPLLALRDIQRANQPEREGLNLVTLHIGFAPAAYENGVVHPEIQRSYAGLIEYQGSGYHLKQKLFEAHTEEDARFSEEARYQLVRDTSPDKGVTFGTRLYRLTVKDVANHPATVTHQLFNYQPPRFYLRPTEQELLQHALLGETDDDLSERLDLSINTIKKRWQSIYARVEETERCFFGEPTALDTSRRGTEKRRLLLNYLRHHREELRPIIRPSEVHLM